MPFDGEQLLRAVEAGLAGVRAVATAQAAPARTATVPVLPTVHTAPGAVRALGNEHHAAAPTLSPREHEVMGLLVQGLHNRRIAEELGISHRTVEVHKARVLEKLGVRSVVELVRLVDRKDGH